MLFKLTSKKKQKKLVDNLFNYRYDRLSELKMHVVTTLADLNDSRIDKSEEELNLLKQINNAIEEVINK